MPNRILRDWTASARMEQLSPGAEILFTRLIMKVDDYGRMNGNPVFVKNSVFPLRETVSSMEVCGWMQELLNLGILIAYEVQGKIFIQIQDFNQILRQKFEKHPAPEKGKRLISIGNAIDRQKPTLLQLLPEIDSNNLEFNLLPKLTSGCNTNDMQSLVNCSLETETETINETETMNRDFKKSHPAKSVKIYDYSKVERNAVSIKKFIEDYRPSEIEPYQDYWNLFATMYTLPKMMKITSIRKKHLSARLRDKDFDFCKILKQASKSKFLLEKSFFTFDWIISSETNYVKVIEGNYIEKQPSNNQNEQPKETITTIREDEGRNILAELSK
jgi:hypothetical protein